MLLCEIRLAELARFQSDDETWEGPLDIRSERAGLEPPIPCCEVLARFSVVVDLVGDVGAGLLLN